MLAALTESALGGKRDTGVGPPDEKSAISQLFVEAAPTMGDPRQAKMMLFMPFVFTFMFLNLPSGLVLYWTVSNVLQILQQKLMDRPARTRATREAKDAGRA